MMKKIAIPMCLVAMLLPLHIEATAHYGKTRGQRRIIKGRKLSEPNVDEMDMSLFREHEEGFPGGLFYEDTEGEAQMQQMLPSWRQAKGGKGLSLKKDKCSKSKGKGSSKGCSSKGKGSKGKGGSGGGWVTAPSPWYGGFPTAPSWPTSPTWPVAPSFPSTPTFPSPSSPTDPIMPISVPVSTPVVAPVSAPSGFSGSISDNSGPTGPIERDWDANSAVCFSIANSSNRRAGGPAIAFNDLSLDVALDLRVRSKNGLNVPALLDSYSKFVRLYCLGCFEEASVELGRLQRRRLVTEPLFQATMNSWFGK